VASTRDIRQNEAGEWDVLKQGDRRAAVTAATKNAAVSRARNLIRREGGGEIRIVNRSGKIVETRPVTADSHPSHDREAA
jgi:hypothetical protein